MSDDGATKATDQNDNPDPCITYDEKAMPHTGKHKFEWVSEAGEYFLRKRCKNCGVERPGA